MAELYIYVVTQSYQHPPRKGTKFFKGTMVALAAEDMRSVVSLLEKDENGRQKKVPLAQCVRLPTDREIAFTHGILSTSDDTLIFSVTPDPNLPPDMAIDLRRNPESDDLLEPE